MATAKFKVNAGICFMYIVASCITAADGWGRIKMSDDCKKTYLVTKGTSPWQGFTSSSGEEEESKTIKSVSLKGSDYKAVPGLEKYSKSGLIIIGRSEKLRRVAVEASLFSDLKRADATRTTSGRFFIGTYRDTAFKVMRPDELAAFLIESQIINTFWHIESQVCLVLEENDSSSYTARYTGKHVYFTNSRNEEPLDFTIIIEKKSGGIFLEAR